MALVNIFEIFFNIYYFQVDKILEGFQAVNLTDVLEDFSTTTQEIVEAENLTTGDLSTSITILTGVKDIAVNRDGQVDTMETEVGLFSDCFWLCCSALSGLNCVGMWINC